VIVRGSVGVLRGQFCDRSGQCWCLEGTKLVIIRGSVGVLRGQYS
jgi:hypothetical protein